ncbi:MAG: hypothetical protein ACXU8U_01235 [Asticcacaulis sp.]
MDTTRKTSIATAAQRQALRRNQQQRLRDQAEALLRAYEALEPPKTHAEAERAGKALLIVQKVVEAVNVETRDDEPTRAFVNAPADSSAEAEALDGWTLILDESLGLLEQARQMRRDAAG